MDITQTIINAAYDTAISAAIQAAEVAMQYWPNLENPHFDSALALEMIHKKGTGNYATMADLAAEQKIIEVIRANPLFASHSFSAEESGEIKADDRWRWIIDPIDGTPNFRNGNPDFGMCIALFNGNQPVVGLIARPALGQLAVARAGSDAKLLDFNGRELVNLRELAERYRDPLGMALVGYDLGYADRQRQLRYIADSVIDKVGYAVCLASFSTGNFRLLQGMMGLYFGFTPTVMDVAPAAALIPAIGGVITDMQGRPIDWQAKERSYVAAINPEIHQQFMSILQPKSRPARIP